MTCETCAHWTTDEKTAPFGACASQRFFLGYHWTLDEVPRDGALIESDEGWGWLTGPDFGCIHFKARGECPK